MTTAVLVTGIAIFTVLLNLPFGYLRKGVRKFSFKWFLYIHLPIPFIFLARITAHLDFRYVPIFVAAAVAGQVLGARI
jgi:hypothetical protein